MQNQELWNAVDQYIGARLLPADELLEEVLKASSAAGLPAIQVSPAQGKFLHLLARMIGARRILEIGTLAGYSAIWMGRALPPDGRLITLEIDPEHAQLARKHIEAAGLAGRVEVRLGRAGELLPKIALENHGSFDLIFIDADKPRNVDYFNWSLRMSRPGGIILIDNTVRSGAIVEAGSHDPSVQGTQRLYEAIGANPRVTATAIQTVGCKGYDGFIMALVG